MIAFFAAHSKIFEQIGINALLALSLSICLQAGQLALAQAAFMGIGAYLGAYLAVTLHWPLAACLATGALAAALTAAIVAFPVQRLRGVFLAIATIGFGEIARIVEVNLKVTGGAEGFSGIPADVNAAGIAAVLVLCFLALYSLRGKPLLLDLPALRKWALAINATREDEAAARGVGIDTAGVRLWTLVAGGAVAGLAGGLYAHSNYFVQPQDFGFERMEQILVYCVIGGAGNAVGAMLGALLMTALPEIFRFLHDYRDVTNGAILLAVVIFAPRGISGVWSKR